MESDSFEEAMLKLLESYPDLDVGNMEEILEQGLLNSALYGIHIEQLEGGDDD